MLKVPRRALFLAAAILVMASATALRTTQLNLRPMHTDEAVQAFILRDIWQEGKYAYDPKDLHGPVLVLSSFPMVWLSRTGEFANLEESTLRSTAALWGIALVALTLIASRWLGWQAALLSALLAALSPMLVFYARYFIMETPLVVCLLLFGCCVARYFETRKIGWIIAGGILAGVMHATKETFVLSVAAMGAGIAGAFLLRKWREPEACFSPFLRPAHLAAGIATALFVSALLMSFFFTRPQAILDSYTTYLNYLDRGAGESGHEKPWHYYFELLGWIRMEDKFVWTEAFTLALALIGTGFAFAGKLDNDRQQFFARALAIYVLASFFTYSIIPYKTPWSIMAPLHGAILLAGFGAWQLLRISCCLPVRLVVLLILGVGSWHLGSQALRATIPTKRTPTVYSNESRNPYLYSQTTPRILKKLVIPVHEVAALHPEGKSMPVSIVHPEWGWPLPWYFRDMEKVGFWGQHPDDGFPSRAISPVMVIDEKWAASLESELSGHVASYVNLRDDEMLVLYIRRDLFDLLVESRSK